MSEKELPIKRPWRRTGEEFPCMICGKMIYRRGSQLARGIRKTCGSRECKSASMRGANNPFWGKQHDPETIAHIMATKRARPNHKGGKKGYKHTPEARTKMSAALTERWRVNRDKMLANNPPHYKSDEERRYRRNFTSVQCELWTESKCNWCDATTDLVLDHIIAVMCGGKNERRNAQTLCMPCNRWKLKYVDRPLFLAGLGSQEAEKL
jgi:hypothetical protein